MCIVAPKNVLRGNKGEGYRSTHIKTAQMWRGRFHSSNTLILYVRVTVHRNEFLLNKTNQTHICSQILFCQKNSTCFGHFLCPSSVFFYCTVQYSTVENSWWWAKEIPETCRVFLTKKICTSGFIKNNLDSTLSQVQPVTYRCRVQ